MEPLSPSSTSASDSEQSTSDKEWVPEADEAARKKPKKLPPAKTAKPVQVKAPRPVAFKNSPGQGCRNCRLRRIKCLRAYPACASCQDRGETCYWNDDDPPPAPRRNQVRRPTTFDASPLAAELHALGEQVQDLVDRVNRIDKARAQATMSYRPPSPDSPNALPFPQPASSATHHPPQSTSSSHPQEQRPPPHPWAQRASPHLQHPCPPAHNSPTPSLHTFVPALHLEQPRTFLHQPTSQGRYYQAPRFVEEARLRQAGGWGGAAG